MTYKTEFPQYDDVLVFPEDWDDISYRNDVAPSFSKDLENGQRLVIFCDYINPEFREFENEPRFCLSVWEDENFVELLCQSDTFEEILSKANRVMS